MKTLNREKRIYQISGNEISIGQIKKYFSRWRSGWKLNECICFYDFEQDAFYLGPAADQYQIDFCVRILKSPCPENSLKELYIKGLEFRTTGSQEMARCLMQAIVKRWEQQMRKEG